MTTRKIYITFIVTLAVLAALFLAELVVVAMANDSNKRELENVYKSTVYDLTDSIDNLRVNMSKLMVASGTSDNRELITDTYRHAETAAQSVSKLPISHENLSKTVKFFNQVGDWCVSYNNAISSSADTTEYKAQADEIFEVTGKLADSFNEISKRIEEKGIYASIGEMRVFPADFEGLMVDMHSSVEYPRLIYDGPFSDDKSYDFAAIENKELIDEAKARSIAEQKFGMSVESVGETRGKADEYCFTGDVSGRECFLSLTKRGGMPVLYDAMREVGKAELGRQACEKKAADALTRLGYEGLEPVWYNSSGGIAYVNLAPVAEGVVCYPDLVKAKIAMDDGELLGFESMGYCNHHERNLTPTIDEGTALSLVSSKLQIKGSRLVIAPIGETEALCYEISGEYKGLDYFIYIDARMGRELNVLRVVDNNQGSLTM